MRSDAGRYESEVDLSASNSPHTQLVLLTGRNKSVLEVGPATGYVTELLRRRGCQVTAIEKDPAAAEIAGQFCRRIIVGDVEEIDLPQTVGEGQFDVVMFGDVLEHLVDPKGILEKVHPLLRDRGYVVASIPNVAHASVRLMLLDGKFEYTEKGLLDHTHLRFFTKRGVETLFEDAGYYIRVWRYTTADTVQDPSVEEQSLRKSEVPPHLLEALRQDPEALTYQFVVRAYPRRGRRPAKRGSQGVPESTDGVGNSLKALWHLEAVLTQKDRDIAQMDVALADKDASLAEKDGLLAQKDALLAQKDGFLAQKDAALDQKEAALTEKDSHIANIEAALDVTEEQLLEVRRQYQLATSTVGFRLLERARAVINRLAPPGTRRRGVLRLSRQGLRIILAEGWWTFLRRAVPVWRWAPRKIRRRGFAPQIGPLDEQYQLWLRDHALTPAQIQRIREEAAQLSYRPKVSIVMPVYNTDPAWLRDAIESVRAQLYDNWELCIADDASSEPAALALLQEYQGDERIKIAYLKENQGISGASNAALAMATGEYVGFLDHDDELKTDALYEMVKLLNEQPDLNFIYSDEDKKDLNGRLVEPFFKPDWSPSLHMSINYVTHFSVFRKQLVDRVGGLRSRYDGSQDYDLALRVTELTDKVGHISRPLYTWRKIPGSAAASTEAKEFAYGAAERALRDALARRGLKGKIHNGLWSKGSYRVRYEIVENPKVTIIIPTRDQVGMLRRCIQSIEKKSTYRNYEIMVVDNDSREQETRDYLSSLEWPVIRYPHKFNFAKIVNTGAREADGDLLIFLNNDTEVISADWIESMLEHGQQPEVAAVGARLLYPDGRVQHEGIIVGLGGGSAGNVDFGGYFGLGEVIRNCTAVTAACMLTRRSVFWEMGGFDEQLGVAFNDVDYCLRARQNGYLIVYTPFATLHHHESATRGRLHPEKDEKLFRQRWGNPGQYRDPYYNPNLDLDIRNPFIVRL